MDAPLLFAQVAVDQPLDGELSYRVPPGLQRDLRPGARVTVPLGKSNRPCAATVLSLSTTPPPLPPDSPDPAAPDLFAPDAAPSPYKDILTLASDVEPVPQDLLGLARWIAAYYVAPIGLTLATIVPAAVKRATRIPAQIFASLASDPPDTPKLSPRTAKALDAVRAVLQGGPRSEADVLAAAQIARPMLRRLADKGFVKFQRRVQMPTPVETPPAPPGVTLTADQQAALDALLPLLRTPRFAVRVLYGVTGSGKTELYMRAIEQVVAQGQRAIVLVPEISLTPQMVRRFTQRFSRVAVLHSGLKDSERHQHWHAIASGWPQVIVGARSAIFAPAADLGLIVVDEEHDPSYKQDSTPRYHGRDVAIRRAQMLGIPILLGSATPALETWHNAHHNAHFALSRLTSRPLGMQMPRVLVVDMRAQSKERRGLHILSTTLEHHLRQILERKKQAIFLLNRRGYAHYVLCPRCNWVMMCANCDATMVVHRTRNVPVGPEDPGRGGFSARYGKVQCHYCLTAMVLPQICPVCQAKLTHLGQGTQRAEDELLRKFPELRLARMDSDAMRSHADYHRTLTEFGGGALDLLIGTQMISKGLDFPDVELVGVLNADLAMTVPDFRAAERTFQLICQVAGRAGRVGGEHRGTVIVQTFQPFEPAIQHACNHDYLGFVEHELPHRQRFNYPPFGRMVRLVLSHKGYTKVHEAARDLVRLIEALTQKLNLPIRWHGPQPPPMERLAEMYRVELLLFCDTAAPLQHLLSALRARGALTGTPVPVSVDVDPVHMM